MLQYQITPKNSGAHLLHIVIEVVYDGDRLTAKIPKWIPGSYKIRDYSRHIQHFQAYNDVGEALNWRKLDSDTWEIDTNAPITILSYEVYAYDLSVRGAYLDDTRLFFNHCCVAMDIVELSSVPRMIKISSPNDWPIFTALPLCGEEPGVYNADNYAHQIDCPVESAQNHVIDHFAINNIRHDIVFTGHIPDSMDRKTMTRHIENICRAEIQLFGGSPLDNYLFMTYLEAKQYGGLEHKNSVAQIAAPKAMMQVGKPMNDKMIDFMGLCSHEYFHLWNIKRLQPKDFQPYDLYREQHTEMLWLFEGFTSYYDELFLLRAGVVDAKTFLNRQAKNLSRVLNVPGRKLQPLAASSFDAWTKLYQADNNSPNHMVSYYAKGAVFALYLDLFIRKHSDGARSLDDVMRYLWENFGAKGIGIDEDDAFAACCRQLPKTIHDYFAREFVNGLHGTEDLPLAELLADFGVDYQPMVGKFNDNPESSDSGLRITMDQQQATIHFLASDSLAAQEGVSVGDVILAINHQQADQINFEEALYLGSPGDKLCLTLARRGRVFEKTIGLKSAPQNHVEFKQNSQNDLSLTWLATWLGNE